MEGQIDKTVSALGWIARTLKQSGSLDESECLGVAAILEGLQGQLESEVQS